MAMRASGGFPAEGFDLPALAAAVGPFPRRGFLATWWEAFGRGRELLFLADANATLPLMRTGSVVQFIGDADLTDYHSPLGSDLSGLIGSLVDRLGRDDVLDLDSLPTEAADPLAAAVGAAGLQTKTSDQTIAMVVDLPATIDDYYTMVGKKERHELRRKRRRYEEHVGPVRHSTHTGRGRGFDEFVRLHRLAPGDKGRFMTGARERFFAGLAAQPGWRIDLLEHGGVATAGLFGWSDDRDYYLYNSSYDPSLHASSPGLVLLLRMIETGIDAGWRRFDFLKGDEGYKARLGARPRRLVRVEAWA